MKLKLSNKILIEKIADRKKLFFFFYFIYGEIQFALNFWSWYSADFIDVYVFIHIV